MFNSGLRDKVNALCAALAGEGIDTPPPSRVAPASSGAWWPSSLGQPSATGSQNAMQYACFPDARRVAIRQAGVTTLYDTGDHRIGGVSQAQSGDQALSFTSQHGTIRASDLPVVR